MSFAQRIEEYRRFMNIDEKQGMAAILGVDKGTYGNYLSEKRTPYASALAEMSNRLGVSVDWLLGQPHASMWSPRIHSVRPKLKALAKSNCGPPLDLLERCTLMLREIEACFPELAEQPWFMPGLVYLSASAYREIMDDPDTEMIGGQVITRLSLFTGIPELWFARGDAKYLDGIAGSDDWEPFLSILVERGISPQEALMSVTAFERHVQSKRALG